jgi:hypothetical protein
LKSARRGASADELIERHFSSLFLIARCPKEWSAPLEIRAYFCISTDAAHNFMFSTAANSRLKFYQTNKILPIAFKDHFQASGIFVAAAGSSFNEHAVTNRPWVQKNQMRFGPLTPSDARSAPPS